MAASSADDIPTQLAALLGKKKVAQIRKTDENPPRISIIDVIATINGKDKNQAAEDLRRISTGHPEVKAICFDFKFPGRGQRDTPATDAKVIVEIIMLPEVARDLSYFRFPGIVSQSTLLSKSTVSCECDSDFGRRASD